MNNIERKNKNKKSDNNIKVVYKKITENLNNKGYINLNHRLVNSKENLAEIACIFRDPRYETFRIIYMNKNKIVGYESISSKNPSRVDIFRRYKDGLINVERDFYKIDDRMKRLKADGYYLVHNHPSNNAKASREDLKTTEYFVRRINGFKGHLIIDDDSYAWIDISKEGRAYSKDYIPINKKEKKKALDKKIDDISNVVINKRSDLVSLMMNIKNTKNYSSAILTDSQGKIRMILDVPNGFLRNNAQSIKQYFKKLAVLNGVTRVFFATDDTRTYVEALKLFNNGTFKDCICYRENGKNLAIYDAPERLHKEELFEAIDSPFVFAEAKRNMEPKEDDENKIRILYKEVGKDPEIRYIENTLKAKQDLVGGYIECYPYDGAVLVCNDEGKLLNLKPNVAFDYDYIAGNLFVIGDDYENGDFKSITISEALKYGKDLKERAIKYLNKDEYDLTNFDENEDIDIDIDFDDLSSNKNKKKEKEENQKD